VPELADALDILLPCMGSSARYPKAQPANELAGVADNAAHAIIEPVTPFDWERARAFLEANPLRLVTRETRRPSH
jgi:hypothetical protein